MMRKQRTRRPDLVASPGYHRAVAELVRDAALAVDYAHNQGILHLDLKPSNLLIDGQGKLWITDFGASRPSSGSGSIRADGVMGTLCYMSPEQALGQDEQLDCRSDVYSLGATLYELLTLERPYTQESPHALLAQVTLERFKPARQVNKSLPPELDAIIEKAMARQPAQRHATARELAEELDKYLLATSQPGTRPARASHRRRSALSFVALVMLVMFAALAVLWLSDERPTPSISGTGISTR